MRSEVLMVLVIIAILFVLVIIWFDLNSELSVKESVELALPDDWPEPKFDLVRGFEDSRLFEWHGQLWTLSTVRELTPEGWCEQVLAPIDERLALRRQLAAVIPAAGAPARKELDAVGAGRRAAVRLSAWHADR